MTSSFTVYVLRREFAAEFTTPDPGVSALLRRTVPPTGREWLPERRSWLVLGTRVEKLLVAFREAGIPIEITELRGGGA